MNGVLAEIGADDIPQVLVYNKIDLNGGAPRVERDEYGKIARIWISARQGLGLDLVAGGARRTRCCGKPSSRQRVPRRHDTDQIIMSIYWQSFRGACRRRAGAASIGAS